LTRALICLILFCASFFNPDTQQNPGALPLDMFSGKRRMHSNRSDNYNRTANDLTTERTEDAQRRLPNKGSGPLSGLTILAGYRKQAPGSPSNVRHCGLGTGSPSRSLLVGRAVRARLRSRQGGLACLESTRARGKEPGWAEIRRRLRNAADHLNK
jgi:hypothetical protein